MTEGQKYPTSPLTVQRSYKDEVCVGVDLRRKDSRFRGKRDPSQRLGMTRKARHSHSIVPGGLLVMS
jgi:hypothetical protein